MQTILLNREPGVALHVFEIYTVVNGCKWTTEYFSATQGSLGNDEILVQNGRSIGWDGQQRHRQIEIGECVGIRFTTVGSRSEKCKAIILDE